MAAQVIATDAKTAGGILEALQRSQMPAAETTKSAVLAKNAEAGRQYEEAIRQGLEKEGKEVAGQMTLKTDNGTKTRVDFLTRDPASGVIGVVEAKGSPTAPLTPNQRTAFPEIERSGATVVGEGKPGFPGGMRIPPTKVQIERQDGDSGVR